MSAGGRCPGKENDRDPVPLSLFCIMQFPVYEFGWWQMHLTSDKNKRRTLRGILRYQQDLRKDDTDLLGEMTDKGSPPQ